MKYRFKVASCLVALAAAATAAGARAEIVTRQDDSGRTITFDVATSGVDVDWYATLMRGAAHGDEISAVTIRVVARANMGRHCPAGAAGCYTSDGRTSVIVVPAGTGRHVAETVLHEYGHHLDAARPVAGVRELNGTPAWWAARGMQTLLDERKVAFDYALGWNRSIGEVFAEDYAWLHVGGSYKIPWLAPPDQALRDALVAELGATSAPPTAPTPPAPPATAKPSSRTLVRRGGLAAGSAKRIPFRLLGPDRRVTLAASVTGAAKIEIVCGGLVVGANEITHRGTVTFTAAGLGPARCVARLASTTSAQQRFVLRLSITVGSPTVRNLIR